MKKLSYMMLALSTLILGACSEDFKDWADPQTNPQEDAITIPGLVATASPVQTITGTAETDSVTLFNLSSDALPEGYSLASARVELTPASGSNTTTVEQATTVSGKAPAAEIQTIVENAYGKRPVNRIFDGHVYLDAVKNGEAALIDAGQISFTVMPITPDVSTTYYLVGGPQGWSTTDKSYVFSHSSADVFDDPVFTITFNVPDETQDTWFAFGDDKSFDALANGDWSQLFGATEGNGNNVVGETSKFARRTAIGDDGSFKVPAGTKVVVMTINVLDETYNIQALSLDPYVYFIGSTDGWAASNQKLALTDNANGIYTGYVYIADPNNWGKAFKLQTVAGSWDNQINAGNTTITSGLTGTDNFEVSEDGVYYITYDAINKSISATRITNMNLVGDFNGWNAADDAQQMTWNATDYCYEITGAGVTANGWKFTANNAWDINLGSNDTAEPSTVINDLSGGGKNIGVVGTTIKLYPCRITSGNIYCTVQ